MDKIKSNLIKIYFVCCITVTWFFKNLYFINELGLSPHKKYILITSTAFALLLASIFFVKKSKISTIIIIFLYFSLSLLLYADVLYERYYDAILSFDLIGQAGQVNDVIDSVFSLMYLSDIWYWIDLPLIIILILFFYKKMEKEKKSITLSLLMLLLGLVSIILITIIPLERNYSDQYKVALTGIVSAHLYGLFDNNMNKDETGTQDQLEIVKKIRDRMKENNNKRLSSEFFGKYKGKNLIVVQAESLNEFPINLIINNQEITPNLNELVKSSNYYPNTYLQIGRGNTSDAEFVANNSIYPMAKQGIYKTYPLNNYLSLANILGEYGYFTNAVHGNTADFWNRQQAYEKLGFQEFYHIDHEDIEKDELIGLGISDESMFRQMLSLLDGQNKPFYSFIVTLSVHRPFELPEEYQKLDLGDLDNTNTANYLESVNYFDRSLGVFIEGLKESGLWEDTIFVLYGDHYGLLPNNKGELESLFNIPFDQKERFKIPLIIHHPGQQEGIVNEVVTSQMDIYPTLSTILGIEEPLVQFGESLYEKKDGFVGFAYETTKYSYYSDTYDYVASHEGTFEAGKCINNITDKETDVEECFPMYINLKSDIEYSDYILRNDSIRDITKESFLDEK
jgi:lipoteichoic acid synthase